MFVKKKMRNLTKFVCTFCLLLMSSSLLAQNSSKERIGEITKHEGYYIYFYSTPIDEYETLGFLKEAKLVWSGKPKEMMKLMMRKTRRKYPNADALIIEDIHMNQIRVIKFSK